MKQAIAVAGTVLSDAVKTIDAYPSMGMLAGIREISVSVGGCVPNTVIDLAKMDSGIPLKAYGRVGEDANGAHVTSEMKNAGVDISGITYSKNLKTSFSDVMSLASTGERTFFHYRGANAEFDLSDTEIDLLECQIFHIGYILLMDELDNPDAVYGTKLAGILKKIRDRGIKTSIDAVSAEGGKFKETILPALKYCDYAILNEIEAGHAAGIDPYRGQNIDIGNVKEMMRALMSAGVHEKVIVHCPTTGFCLDKSGRFSAVPSLALPEGYIKGTVGAGDAFCAGALYSLYHGFDDEKMLDFAAGAAACNLSEKDSVSGMKSAEEIYDILITYPRRAL